MYAAEGALLGMLLACGLLLLVLAWISPRHEVTKHRQSSLSRLIRDAGVSSVTPAGVISASIVCGLCSGLLALVVTAVPVVGLLAGLVGVSVPLALVRRRAHVRRKALAASWVDAVDALVSAIRAGLSMSQALSDLGHRGPQVLQPAFRDFESDLRVTGSLTVSLDALQERLADPTADRVLTALRIAHDVGGCDVGNVLRTLSAMLREDIRLRGEIEARQSWTVNAARLAVIAPWATLAFLCTRHEAVVAYATPMGGLVLLVSAAVTAIAYVLMRRIARLPRETRFAS